MKFAAARPVNLRRCITESYRKWKGQELRTSYAYDVKTGLSVSDR